jgi:cytochrome b
MTAASERTLSLGEAGGSELPSESGRVVWDPAVRIFHWSLASLMLLSWISADQGWMKVHLWSGVTVLTLLTFRVAWGFLGSSTARFSSFVAGPRATLEYLQGLSRGQVKAHIGHNPAGGWSVVLLLATLTLQVATGLVANDGVRFDGPLVPLVGRDLSDRATDLHVLTFNAVLVLVWLHLVAAFFYLLVKGDNLIRPMITGRKNAGSLPDGARVEIASSRRAAMVAAAAALAVYLLVFGGP